MPHERRRLVLVFRCSFFVLSVFGFWLLGFGWSFCKEAASEVAGATLGLLSPPLPIGGGICFPVCVEWPEVFAEGFPLPD